MYTQLFEIVLGVILVLAGSSMFWLFVGVIGFVIGFQLATAYFSHLTMTAALVLSLLAGLAGGILAFFAQALAVLVGGFLGGGYLAVQLAGWGSHVGEQSMVLFIIGGLIGAAAMYFLFDIVLIVGSSLLGALLITRNVPVDPSQRYILLAILTCVGVIIQFLYWYPKRTERRTTYYKLR